MTDYICDTCGGKGGYRRNSEKFIEPCRCEECTLKGTEEEAKIKNDREYKLHCGAQVSRIEFNPLEKAYHDHWYYENRPMHGVNGGYSMLQNMLNKSKTRDLFMTIFDKVDSVTERDYEVAATVIQWLGSNCGRCFLEEVQTLYKKYKKDFVQKEN